MKKALMIGIVLAMVVLMAAGCSKTKKTVVVPGGKATVTTDKSGEGKVEIEGKEGKATIEVGESVKVTEAELGVPIYPGATAQASSKFEGKEKDSGKSAGHYVLVTSDSVDKVAAFYKSNLKDVKNPVEQNMGNGKMVIFTLESDGKQISVHISSNEENKQTMIMVMKIDK